MKGLNEKVDASLQALNGGWQMKVLEEEITKKNEIIAKIETEMEQLNV